MRFRGESRRRELHTGEDLVVLQAGPMRGPPRGGRNSGGGIGETIVSFPLKDECQESEREREESEEEEKP